ncbi:hypothetical protein GCM10010211_57910 [Streptomyces albospinus]|uniref:Uncharacterized protein n=1 Tax=Streptomyces albospinus TaxID=285515 RepID=A0ABQ2VFF8_9ACTN|nr:hypothetical protein GCM10010211_57910 [Streptomyces albospinus]
MRPAPRSGPGHPEPAALVLFEGNESARARRPRPLTSDGPAFRTVAVGRDLTHAVTDAPMLSDLPVCAVPIPLPPGRGPRIAATAARALRRLTGLSAQSRIALAESFGNTGHRRGQPRRVPPRGDHPLPRNSRCSRRTAVDAAPSVNVLSGETVLSQDSGTWSRVLAPTPPRLPRPSTGA